MPKFSKKTYEFVADVLNKTRRPKTEYMETAQQWIQWDYIVNMFVAGFHVDNPRFDEPKFRKWANKEV